MLRRLVVAVALSVVALAGPADAGAAGVPPARDVMAPAPAGFQPYTGDPSYNGAITRAMFVQLAGAGAVDDIPDDDLERTLRGSWARTLRHETTGNVLVTFGYRLPSDDDAAAFVKGAVESSDSGGPAIRSGGGDGYLVFKQTTPAGESRQSFARQGRYVYQFVVVARAGHADLQLPEDLARRQLDLLPAGSRSFDVEDEPVSYRIGRAAPIVAILLAIAVFVARSNRKRKQAVDAAVADPPPE